MSQSDCCGAPIHSFDICSDCKEHCDVLKEIECPDCKETYLLSSNDDWVCHLCGTALSDEFEI